MQIIRMKQKPLMTYDQWVILHAKNCMRGKIKRFKRKFRKIFVCTWNGMIDGIISITHFVSENKKKLLVITGVFVTMGIITMTVIGLYQAGESDAFSMGIRTKYGTYQNGYVKTLDDKEWEMIPPSMKEGLLENELVTITFNTNGTEEISDDTVSNIEGWGICK